MSQLIYSLAALVTVILFSLSMNQGMNSEHTSMYATEILSQMSGVAEDIIDDVGRRALPFDSKVDPEFVIVPELGYPIVLSATQITPEGSFGGCLAYDLCADLDDFHGLTVVRSVGGLDFEAAIEVVYVDEDNPMYETGIQTFAKKVTITVTQGAVVIGGEPLTTSYSRVFTYDKPTNFPIGAVR
jgi:hypothetical protein